MKEKKKLTPGTILFYLIPVIAGAAAIIFGYLYMKDYLKYKEAADEYADINDNYIQILEDTEEPEDEYDERTDYFPTLSIDFQELKSINDSMACVLYVPALDMTYPVVYSKDNEDYLHKTFEGKYNFAGCIFYDYLSERNFKGYNTFIFGHNMKNGSMFGTLKKFNKEPGLAASNPYFYIYTDGQVRKYEIFSYYQTVGSSKTYDDILSEEDYDAYIDRALKNSNFTEYAEDIEFNARPGMVTLSTCSGRSGGNERFVVHGALISTKNPSKGKRLNIK